MIFPPPLIDSSVSMRIPSESLFQITFMKINGSPLTDSIPTSLFMNSFPLIRASLPYNILSAGPDVPSILFRKISGSLSSPCIQIPTTLQYRIVESIIRSYLSLVQCAQIPPALWQLILQDEIVAWLSSSTMPLDIYFQFPLRSHSNKMSTVPGYATRHGILRIKGWVKEFSDSRHNSILNVPPRCKTKLFIPFLILNSNTALGPATCSNSGFPSTVICCRNRPAGQPEIPILISLMTQISSGFSRSITNTGPITPCRYTSPSRSFGSIRIGLLITIGYSVEQTPPTILTTPPGGHASTAFSIVLNGPLIGSTMKRVMVCSCSCIQIALTFYKQKMERQGLLQDGSMDDRDEIHGTQRVPMSKANETLELRIDSMSEQQEWKHINPATVSDIDVTDSPRRVKMINSEVSSLDDKKATPMSPGRRAFRVVSAYLNQITSPIWMPAQYVARKFRAGGVKGSIFTLMSAILGAGILTLPYAVYANGLILGPLLILIGALLSYYTGYLLCLVGQKLNKERYEDIAMIIYGKKMSMFAAALIIINLLGVVIAYIVLIKSLIPQTIDSMSKGKASKFIKNEILWATIVSYGIIFPLSLLRKMSSLRFSSIFGFACVLYLTILIIVEFFFVTEHKTANWKNARLFHVSINGIFGSFPLVIFAFLYQPNIPSIYMELNNKSLKRMDKVLTRGSIICIVIYIVVGIMGYATFVDKPQQMEKKNILAATAYSSRIECQIAFIFLSLVIFAASPVCIKPVKDSFQLIIWNGAELSNMANFWLTFALVTVCYGLAVVVPIISDVIQVLGDTSSPLVCFTLPILFYLKIDTSPTYSCKRIFAHFVNVLTLLIGVLGLISFILDKLKIKLD